MQPPRTRFTAPFPPGYRACGVLLHVTSLPSRYGIGDMGPAAFAWVDQLAAAGQGWWQILPLGPTGASHSPYRALSSFAANLLVLSPERLMEEGLLDPADCEAGSFPSDRVAFERVIPFKERLLARAWAKFKGGVRKDLRGDFDRFCAAKDGLQAEPALFMALRSRFGGGAFQDWPSGLALRDPVLLSQARREMADGMQQFRFGQFILLRHWKQLKDYANQRGVRLLGDLPFFVSPDSSDVWAHPGLFRLDERRNPRVVAGVPPDYFTTAGQLWGNPVYDWEEHRRTCYQWWIDRFRERLDYLDAIRIDHFRAFEAAWHVPAGAETAVAGEWVPGPGAELFDKVRQSLGGLPLLAEDLGFITPAVEALRDTFQLPGMRILQFGFGSHPDPIHQPQNCVQNGVVYTGTHDNDTTRGWYDALPEPGRRAFWDYLRRSPGGGGEAVWELIRLAWSSVAALAVVPLQDLLGLGSEARMNVPGRPEGQWRWRCPDDVLYGAPWDRLRDLTRASDRLGGAAAEPQAGPDAAGKH